MKTAFLGTKQTDATQIVTHPKISGRLFGVADLAVHLNPPRRMATIAS
jgi:hypothetical protein